jgi:NAD+ synthase
MATVDRLARWMRERLQASTARGFVVGLSGGVDSAVVARLAQLAAPGAVTGLILPCHSDPQDERDAVLVARHFSLPVVRMDLSSAYDAMVTSVQPTVRAIKPADDIGGSDDLRARLPLANMKPRLRMTALYFVANSLNLLVTGTGNRSEATIGYFTKWGDGGVDVLPLGRLSKGQVRGLAQELRVPQEIIDKPPSAGLWIGQTDEDEMGFSYAELEGYLKKGAQGVSPATFMRIERLERASQHKRELPAMPDFE